MAPTASEQPHRGGILRLPPDAMTSGNNAGVVSNSSQSSDWRAHPPPPAQPHQQPQQVFPLCCLY